LTGGRDFRGGANTQYAIHSDACLGRGRSQGGGSMPTLGRGDQRFLKNVDNQIRDPSGEAIRGKRFLIYMEKRGQQEDTLEKMRLLKKERD